MSNGSSKSKGRFLQKPAATGISAQRYSSLLALLLLAGCHREARPTEPDLQQAMASVSAEELFDEGIAHAMRSDMLRAEHYLNAAKARGYDPAEAVAWLVTVCVASNRFNAALRHAEPYLRRHPEDWSLHFVVANIHDALGNVDAARRHLERVVSLAPGQPLPHYRLGLFYRERLRDEEASETHFAEYIRLAPSGPHAAEAGDALRAPHPTEEGPKRIKHPKPLGHEGAQ